MGKSAGHYPCVHPRNYAYVYFVFSFFCRFSLKPILGLEGGYGRKSTTTTATTTAYEEALLRVYTTATRASIGSDVCFALRPPAYLGESDSEQMPGMERGMSGEE